MSFDKAKFFDICRKGIMGPTLDAEEVSGSDLILDAFDGQPLSWVAYALATAWHETAHEMHPISEYGGNTYFTRMYDIKGQRPTLAQKFGNTSPGDGIKYHGRGFVQLTWKVNYQKASEKIGVDLVNNPERAKEPAIAARIMLHGMIEGWFTNIKFATFLPTGLRVKASKEQFRKSRRIINGSDKDELIAGYALAFQNALADAGWGS